MMGEIPTDTMMRKVFVGGLPYATTNESLKEYFGQFGPITEAVVITDKQTGKSKGFGFVTYVNETDATKACANPKPIIEGRQANCNLAYLGAKNRAGMTTPRAAMGAMDPTYAMYGQQLAQQQPMADMAAAYQQFPGYTMAAAAAAAQMYGQWPGYTAAAPAQAYAYTQQAQTFQMPTTYSPQQPAQQSPQAGSATYVQPAVQQVYTYHQQPGQQQYPWPQ